MGDEQDRAERVRQKMQDRYKEVYKERYGNRDPESLSSRELEGVARDSQIAVQKELRERKGDLSD